MEKRITYLLGDKLSFLRKSIFIIFCLLAGVSSIQAQFVHPGISHKKSDLDRMKYMVEAQIDPWYSSYQNMVNDSKSSYNYVVQGKASFTELGRDSKVNYNAWNSDIRAAYYNAIMWSITEDTRHADKAVEIFKAWSNLTSVTSGGTDALSGGVGYIMVEAAELIKSTYSGWQTADIDKFKAMLVYPGYSTSYAPSGNTTFYWKSYQGDPVRHGNQGLSGWRTVMAMGIFLDNEIMYDRSLRYLQGNPHRSDDLPYPEGPNTSTSVKDSGDYADTYNITRGYDEEDYGYNEVMTNYIYANGQCQESSRDQGHVLFGIGLINSMAEMAWNQGDDLYSHENSRLLLGLEYSLKYNVSFLASYPDQVYAWNPTNFLQGFDRTGRWYSKAISPVGIGGFTSTRPNWEMSTAHYIGRGIKTEDEAKWNKRARDKSIELSGYEKAGWTNDAIGWGGLTFRRPVGCYGDPISGFDSNNLPMYAMNVVPEIIEAENFDYDPSKNGEGRVYHDLSSSNTGGVYRTMDNVDVETISGGGNNLTSIESGEWLTYTIAVQETAKYSISIKYAASQAGGTIKFNAEGVDVTSDLSVPFGEGNSNGNTDWKDYEIANDIVLNKGVQSLKVFFAGVSNSFKLDNFKLTKTGIVKQDQSIQFSTIPNITIGSADLDLGATASSGLVVNYSSSNTAVATIVNGKVHIVAKGTATITATQGGNDYFNAAADVLQELNVIDAATSTSSLSAIADTYVHENKATSNFGTGTSMVTKLDARYCFLKFDLNSIPGDVVSAKLRLYQRTSFEDTRNVYAVADDSWGETSITWNNKPAFGNQVASIVTSKSTWNEWDVSSYVAQEYNNDKTITFVVKDPANSGIGIDFYTKENGTNMPELVVEYSDNSLSVNDEKSLVEFYPNPVKDKLNLSLIDTNLNLNETEITIYALNGQKLMQTKIDSKQVSLNLSKLNSGVYFLIISDGNSSIRKKIVKF